MWWSPAARGPASAKESASKDAFGRGELGLDRYGLRAVLSGLGVEYVDYQAYVEAAQ
jgi:4-hydroxy-4-methyl-2-oxoglutarate aldolase